MYHGRCDIGIPKNVMREFLYAWKPNAKASAVNGKSNSKADAIKQNATSTNVKKTSADVVTVSKFTVDITALRSNLRVELNASSNPNQMSCTEGDR